MKKKIYLHIGYPKTGTTTIQKHFFPRISEVQYIHKFFDKSNSPIYKDVIEVLFNNKTEDINFVNLQKILDENLLEDKIVISSENFLFKNFIPEKFYNQTVLYSPKEIANNIRNLFDPEKYDVKIIITIRRQESMITSLFAQVYTNVYSNFKEYDTFEKYLGVFIGDKYPKHIFRQSLNYNEIALLYGALFNNKNVLINVYEKLLTSPASFYKELCSFLEISEHKYSNIALDKHENTRTSKEGYKNTHDKTLRSLLRKIRFNYFPFLKFKLSEKQRDFLDSIILSKNKTINKTIYLNIKERKLVQKEYEKTNTTLSKRLNLKLEKHGYFE